ncbi:hypothetical protein JHK87_015838 [Glycine soja]|nr:hypothetical protein JHK87_015838 [Glycine soja]
MNGGKGERSYANNCLLQVEVGEGLSGEEKREVKSEILRIMKEASHSLKQSLPLKGTGYRKLSYSELSCLFSSKKKNKNAGLAKAAKEEHARDLPLMNGIKEVIKSVGVLDSSNLDYHEALYNLSSQVKSLQDKHNPHLELTLSTRKKISSILEHLNRKWGNSSIAAAEVMFFPYGGSVKQKENVVFFAQLERKGLANKPQELDDAVLRS